MCAPALLSLPQVVKRRVNALKNLQVKCAHIEAKFYEEVHELERKYAALYQPLYDKVRVHTHSFSSFTCFLFTFYDQNQVFFVHQIHKKQKTDRQVVSKSRHKEQKKRDRLTLV